MITAVTTTEDEEMSNGASLGSGIAAVSLTSSNPLGEGVLLRTLMKNHPAIAQAVWSTMREKIAELGVTVHDDVWRYLVVAHASELEHSKLHVIE
jgi:hypothetical protein